MKAVIYARYSSASQREESIEGQVKECTAYAERNGYMVIGTYADRAVSGTTDNRPEFQRMILSFANTLHAQHVKYQNNHLLLLLFFHFDAVFLRNPLHFLFARAVP